MEQDKKDWTSRFTPESIDEIINQKTIMFCDIAQPNTEFDAITVGRIKKDKTIEIVSVKTLPTDLPYEERQTQFNQEVDRIAEQYNCLDVIKDGSFNELSNFEKSKRRERGIVIIGAAGGVGKTTFAQQLAKDFGKGIIIVDDLVETTKTDRQKAQDFANLAIGDFKFADNFEKSKSKYHK